MGCCNSQTRGCFNIESEEPNQLSKGQASSLNKLNVYDWLDKLHENNKDVDLVEIRFKNTRKDFYNNVNGLKLNQGDVVAVEASPGHDIGVISLTGPLVKEQIKKSGTREKEFKKIYRKAKGLDIEKWESSIELEKETMLRSRILARELGLDMKIGDVEYQGDRTKAIFYYIADERVDFRQLIKNLAEEFKIRIEMRQIGARQEAGRIGGVGSCGRELCCSGWMSSFSSVSTNAARDQEMSLNPQKLAGQCGKLKCCLNFEVDVYKDAKKAFPNTKIVLDTEDGPAYYHKSDVLQGIMWYSFDKNYAVNLTPLPVDRVKELIELNKTGKKITALVEKEIVSIQLPDFDNIVGQDSLTRFDRPAKAKSKNKKRSGNKKKKANPNANKANADNQAANAKANPATASGPNKGPKPAQKGDGKTGVKPGNKQGNRPSKPRTGGKPAGNQSVNPNAKANPNAKNSGPQKATVKTSGNVNPKTKGSSSQAKPQPKPQAKTNVAKKPASDNSGPNNKE